MTSLSAVVVAARFSLQYVALFAAAAVPIACRQCEDEHCDDYLVFVFEKATPWELGTYQVTVRLDDEIVECSIEVPEATAGTCDDSDTRILFDRNADTPNISRVSHYFTSPREVEITLALEGTQFFQATTMPTYEKTANWNSLCGPACDEGHADLAIP